MGLALLPTVGFGAFLWMGLYIFSRASRQTPLTIVSLIGMLAQATFFFGTVTTFIVVETKEGGAMLARFFWWSNVLPIAFWFHICSLVVRRGRPGPILTPAAALLYTGGILLAIIGTFSDLFLDYKGAGLDSSHRVFVGVGSAYEFYMLFIVLAGGGAVYNLVSFYVRIRLGTTKVPKAIRYHIGLLTLGGVVFLASGLYLSIKLKYVLEWPDAFAYLLLLFGLALCGYAIVHYDMLVEGKSAGRDFLYSFTGVFLINFLYCAPLSMLGLNSPLALMILVGLVTATHTLFDLGRGVMDNLFFSKAERTARSEARSYATVLASQPVLTPEIQSIELGAPAEANHVPPPPDEMPVTQPAEQFTPKAFNDAVRRAITGLKSPPQLVKSPLLSLMLVEKRLKQQGEEDNRLNRAAALKSLISELIERLRPDGNASYGSTDAWRFYNVLYFPYVREISKKQSYAEARRVAEERRRNGVREPSELEKTLEWLSDVDEDTFYKWQRRASDTIAAILREEEMRLRQESGLGAEGLDLTPASLS